MEKRLETRLYNRIATLTQYDGGRLMKYLQAASVAERRAKHEQKRKCDGYRRIPIWVHETDLATLRERYPGPRGGVDWGQVIQAAMSGAVHAQP